jgi:large subunit ribosomal protein L35
MAQLLAARGAVSLAAQLLRCLVCATLPSPMPKMKTHSGAKKRFRKTATGKLRARHAFSTHILEKKSPKRKRHFADPVEISRADRSRVTKLLGGAGR